MKIGPGVKCDVMTVSALLEHEEKYSRKTEYFSSCSSIADAVITSRFTTGSIFTCATGILEVLAERV